MIAIRQVVFNNAGLWMLRTRKMYLSGIEFSEILSYFSGNSDSPGLFVAEYKSFVESGINDQNNPFNEVKAGLVLGKKNFKVFKQGPNSL